jgi:dihydrofolate reductase
MLYGIVAAAKHPDGSYVIGNGATMPWHLPGELKWFRQQTSWQTYYYGAKNI